MRRRTFLSAATAALIFPWGVSRAWATAVSGLWVKGPLFPKTPYRVKGTLYFRLSGDRSDRALNTYWNGDPVKDMTRQCPELIKRYAKLLGFRNFANVATPGDRFPDKPSLGNGDAVAGKFVSESGGGFKLWSNGSADLPKTGSVVSISGFSVDGIKRIDGGHVGILCNYQAPGKYTTVVRVLLFDQNMPTDYWKEVRFEKSGGKWYGFWMNNGRDHKVVACATPTG
jgi:hypothetical protein